MPPQSCRHHIFHCCSSIAIYKTCHCSHTTLNHHSHTHTLIVILRTSDLNYGQITWTMSLKTLSFIKTPYLSWCQFQQLLSLQILRQSYTAVISYTCPSMTLFHILKVKFRWMSNNVSMTKLLLSWRQLNSSRKHLIGIHLNIILNTKNAVEGRVLPITVVKLKPLKGKFEGKCPASFVC